MIAQKQMTLAEIFTDCQEKFEADKPAFLKLLEDHIDLDEIVPVSFVNHFYASTGRIHLVAVWFMFILRRIFVFIQV